MSLFVFAGSAQFLATALVASGTPLPVIVLTTFVVNVRHALYSATLAPYLKHLSQKWLAPLGFWLTDETFVITAAHYQSTPNAPHKHWYQLGSSIAMYINWQFWTFVGIVAGSTIPNPSSWGLDFALSVTFIGMIIPMIKNRPVLAAVIVAAVTAVLAYPLPNNLGLLIAALLGVVAGVVVESLAPRPRFVESKVFEPKPERTYAYAIDRKSKDEPKVEREN
jgi:4-azaleucine resistance transporter AzlC